MKIFNPAFRLYKARKDNYQLGSASSWEFKKGTDKNPPSMFLQVAKQLPETDSNGNSTFDWENGRTVNLKEIDIGSILMVLEGRSKFLGQADDKTTKGKGLYHQTRDSNCIIKLYKHKEGAQSFALEISHKKGGTLYYCAHTMSDIEARVLIEILRRVLQEIYLSGSYFKD